jgi:NAD(P) transhydrogenase subunit alpha
MNDSPGGSQPSPVADVSTTSVSDHAPLTVGIPKEVLSDERRVAATPETVKRLTQKLGFSVVIESGAGERADFRDAAYEAAGARIVPNAATVWAEAKIILKVRAPEPSELAYLRSGQIFISFIRPAQNQEFLKAVAAKGATAFAIDTVPRISRAQKMDALSSMANTAGYRAVIEAAYSFPRFFTGQITAAGKVPPAKILVIGAGVAGLAAIGAGRALGAIVRAFDTRPVVREQVGSMGAEFLTVEIEESGEGEGGYAKEVSKAFIDAEMALFAEQAKDVDIIVTTALIPGKPAPKLITAEMVRSMRPGSVIVDLASEMGGNCELTVPGEKVVREGVTIIGYTDLPSRMAPQASQLYGSNLAHLLDDMGGAAKFHINYDDEVVRGSIVVHDGQITWPPPKVSAPSPAAVKPKAAPVASGHGKHAAPKKKSNSIVSAIVGAVVLLLVARFAPASFLSHLTVFVLAIFVGWQVIWNVTPALHTPLMSVTNAISGIIILGGMLQIGIGGSMAMTILSTVAVFLATINIAGGFLVTQRMLKMFRK